jgi:hypothetical protein
VTGAKLVFRHLRHPALNVLREAGVDSAARDYLAGHASKSVGEGTYQRRSIDSMRPDVEQIKLVWAGVQSRFCASSCAQVTRTSEESEP